MIIIRTKQDVYNLLEVNETIFILGKELKGYNPTLLNNDNAFVKIVYQYATDCYKIKSYLVKNGTAIECSYKKLPIEATIDFCWKNRKAVNASRKTIAKRNKQ